MDDLREKYLSLISAATDEFVLEDLRVQALGKKGEIIGQNDPERAARGWAGAKCIER
jgi:hypothetical protein